MDFVVSSEQLASYFSTIKNHVESHHALVTIKYLKLADQTVRVLCYTTEILSSMEKHLPYVLTETADRYDTTLIVWKETNAQALALQLNPQWSPKINMRLRLEMIVSHTKCPPVHIIEQTDTNSQRVTSLAFETDYVNGWDAKNKICYYGVPDFSPEEFIKAGHTFIQQINRLVQNEQTNIAHGAIIGFNNNGLLMCARGQRGKSTLTVHAMMHGFEYVADDYQILQHRGNQLYAWPIYSIITLSPKMYTELYDDLKGKFVSNNARKDKYVINIAPYHNQFRSDYPIRLCLFPEIVSDTQPSITFCTPEEKGRAIVQLIQSTVMQMQDLNNPPVIKKMFDMVKDLDFYKFNLCHNIDANTEYLRSFLNKFDFSVRKGIPTDKIMIDITFDIANILDSETYTIYTMNQFATHLYEKLLSGISKDTILGALEPYVIKNKNLKEEFELFVETVQKKGFIRPTSFKTADAKVNPVLAHQCAFHLSLHEFAPSETIELINLKKG